MDKLSKESKTGFLFISPGLIGLSIFYLIPMVMMIYYSFTKNSKFVGLLNYIEVYQNNIFKMALFNSLIFAILGVSLITVSSLILSSLLKRVTIYKKIIQSIIFSPLIIPSVSVIMLFDLFFNYNGVFNNFLNIINYNSIDFYDNSASFLLIIGFYLWKNIGYNIIIFTAALENVNVSMYESASIDGASTFQKFIYITLPSIKSTVIFVVLISLLNTFKAYREIYLLFGAYPNPKIYTLQHYMNNLFNVLDYQKLSVAASTLLVIIVFIISILLFVDRRD